jgi:hypothetical protein
MGKRESFLLTTGETARVLKIAPSTVIWYANRHRLPALRTESGVRVFLRPDVERFAAQRNQAAANKECR